MMSLLFVFASLAVATPATQPPAQLPGGALREIVYNVTTDLRISAHIDSYEGSNSGQGGNRDRGTVTVDVMAIANDALGVQVTELMGNKGSPYQFNGEVLPDGTVIFQAGSIEDVTRELLQYFGPQFIPADKGAVGDSWTINDDRNGTKVQTTFTVTKVEGDLMTLHEQQHATFSTYAATATAEGTIVIKPSLLVPIRGDVQKTIVGTSSVGENKRQLTLHFERASDTRDVPNK